MSLNFVLSECPPCYDLILEQVNIIRQKMKELQVIIGDVGRQGGLSEAEFRRQMTEVNDSLLKLLLDARRAVGKLKINVCQGFRGLFLF